MTGEEKYQELLSSLQTLGSLVVAFSGGVDSTFLLYAARQALGDRVVAFTVDTPYHARWEIEEAVALAQKLQVKHVIQRKEEILPEVADNPPERCYLCKKALFKEILGFAKREGLAWVADGTNADDSKDYRPGLKALRELGIRSPLREMGFTKEEIRAISKELNLPTWDKPAYACLLSRIPYGQKVRVEDLKKIERVELYLINLGFKVVRVRLHEELARIEVAPSERGKFFQFQLLDEVVRNFKGMGFKYVTLDLEGYRTGSLNEVLCNGREKTETAP
ncbi:MAG: pyridinium-3,5-biscarboxylic acid mononucleotide sulfurtransferase [Candidatus Atribacteria bacterium]|jgi:uncharacterized protein|nr:pyridinium-3,5-biscarboxylic acid mononucleotide sulfurtransferase [Candidatus Atribacteria bacterium]